MPTYPSAAETGGGNGIIWEDGSGGYVQIVITAPDHTGIHKFHLAPFNASTLAYNTVGGGQEASVLDTVGNLIAAIRTIYGGSVTISPGGLFQVMSPGIGTVVVPVTWPGGFTVAGSDAGATKNSAAQASYTAHGADFSRWGVHFFAVSASFWGNLERVNAQGTGDAVSNLGQYLVATASGIGLAGHGAGLKTQVVTHSGSVLVAPIWYIVSANKRLRRRLGIA